MKALELWSEIIQLIVFFTGKCSLSNLSRSNLREFTGGSSI